MYVPNSFAVKDQQVLADFIAAHSFATLISDLDGAPFATHLPLIYEPDTGPSGVLLGHLARANPHWQAFDGEGEVLTIFNGPHAYISPTWYHSTQAVPTWNYAVAHVYGVAHIVEDEAWLADLVDRLVQRYEAGQPQPWSGYLPANFKANLLRAIVGFSIAITRVEGKFKLGQNRPEEDQRKMVQHLEQQADPAARALADLTRQQLD